MDVLFIRPYPDTTSPSDRLSPAVTQFEPSRVENVNILAVELVGGDHHTPVPGFHVSVSIG